MRVFLMPRQKNVFAWLTRAAVWRRSVTLGAFADFLARIHTGRFCSIFSLMFWEKLNQDNIHLRVTKLAVYPLLNSSVLRDV